MYELIKITENCFYIDCPAKIGVVKTGDKTSLLRVTLLTGRTHQIRAHLAFYGHFIIGDGKYGKNAVNKEFKVNKQQLSSDGITFYFDKNSPLYYLNEKNFTVDKKFTII